MTPRFFPFVCLSAFCITLLPQASFAAHRSRHHAASTKQLTRQNWPATPVPLTEQPGTELDKIARTLSKEDLAITARHGEKPLVLIGTANLSATGGEKALFVQLQSPGMCGSAGCATSVYLFRNHQWEKILDSVSGPVTVLPEHHHGMQDLLVGDNDKWIWHNGQYQDTISATPDPQPAKHHTKKVKKKKKAPVRHEDKEETPVLKG